MNSLAYKMSGVDTDNMMTMSYLSSGKDEIKQIKSSAIRLLARREYSRLELFRRLSQKYASANDIQYVLDQLQEQGYQSDDRFAESFIRSKVSSGNGPVKIKIALRERGVCESTALAVFDRLDIDWFAIASHVAQKRFTHSLHDTNIEDEMGTKTKSREQYAKEVRYLKNKGFYQEHIDQALTH